MTNVRILTLKKHCPPTPQPRPPTPAGQLLVYDGESAKGRDAIIRKLQGVAQMHSGFKVTHEVGDVVCQPLGFVSTVCGRMGPGVLRMGMCWCVGGGARMSAGLGWSCGPGANCKLPSSCSCTYPPPASPRRPAGRERAGQRDGHAGLAALAAAL